MNRRSFLAAIAGAFAADPERLLWIPGAKTISIPAPRVRYVTYSMLGQISTPQVIYNASLSQPAEIIAKAPYKVRIIG